MVRVSSTRGISIENIYLEKEILILDPNLTNPNNYRSIRYSDVLLMAAESHNRKPNPNDEKL